MIMVSLIDKKMKEDKNPNLKQRSVISLRYDNEKKRASSYRSTSKGMSNRRKLKSYLKVHQINKNVKRGKIRSQ